MIGARAKRRHRGAARQLGVIGLLTALVLALVFYISYNASRGLPWQSTYDVFVEVPNASRLVDTNDVRIGGVRVGRVVDVSAVPPGAHGRAFARVELALEPSAGPLPADTAVRVRPASVLGASFVDLEPGTSAEGIPDGGALPLANASATTDLTDLFEAFDSSTARTIRSTLAELGTGLAGQGAALNASLGSFSELLPPLTRVSRLLATPDTRLAELIRGYDDFTRALAPAAPALGELMRGGQLTLDAIARAELAATIEAFPPAELATTQALTRLQPSLVGLADLIGELRDASPLLPGTLARINASLRAGVRPLRELPPFSERLEATLAGIERVTRLRSTDGGVRQLTSAVRASGRTLELLTPAQVHCNVFAAWLTHFGSATASLGAGTGPALIPNAYAQVGAENELFQNPEPSPNIGINYLPHQNAEECESGNELHDGVSQVLNNPPGLQGKEYARTEPPAGVRERARQAGLLDPPLLSNGEGSRR